MSPEKAVKLCSPGHKVVGLAVSYRMTNLDLKLKLWLKKFKFSLKLDLWAGGGYYRELGSPLGVKYCCHFFDFKAWSSPGVPNI